MRELIGALTQHDFQFRLIQTIRRQRFWRINDVFCLFEIQVIQHPRDFVHLKLLIIRQFPVRAGFQHRNGIGPTLDIDFVDLIPVNGRDALVAPIENRAARFFRYIFIDDENGLAR